VTGREERWRGRRGRGAGGGKRRCGMGRTTVQAEGIGGAGVRGQAEVSGDAKRAGADGFSFLFSFLCAVFRV
jgi:hypothetical protein